MTTKQCRTCLQNKPLDAFPARKDSPDGLRNECRECRAKAQAERRTQPDLKLRRKLQGRLFYERHREEIKEKYRETLTRGKRAWIERNPDARRAHSAVGTAVKRGKMPKAPELTCVQCGAQASHYHHHHGYDRAHRLDVVPLCHTCHLVVHQERNQ